MFIFEVVLDMETKVMKNIGNWNSIFVNELDILSCIFEEHKSYCHINIS